eukprot:6357106-Heterocapsa_arctica.AAC.1
MMIKTDSISLEHEKEDTQEVHTQGQHQMDEETTFTQISGERKDEEDKNIADYTKVGQTIGNDKHNTYHKDQHSDHKGKEIYPGVSSQKS